MIALYLLLSLSMVSGVAARAKLPEQLILQDRIQGAIVGAALGDAFGRVTTSFDTTQEIHNAYGNQGLGSFSQFKKSDWRYDTTGKKYAPWSDNTLFANALSTILLEGRKRELSPSLFGDITGRSLLALTNFGREELAVYDNMRNRRLETIVAAERLAKMGQNKTDAEWWVRPLASDHRSREISQEAGSSVLARAWPVGMVYADDPLGAREVAKAITEVTHRHPTALAASAAIVAGITYSLRGESVDEIVNRMAYAAERFDRAEKVYKRDAVKIRSRRGYKPEMISHNAMLTSDMIRYAASMAQIGASPAVVLGDTGKKQDNNRSQRGYFLGYEADEAVAAAVYIFVRNAHNLKGALVEAAQAPGQSDLISSLVGALVGARVGYQGFAHDVAADLALLEEHDALVSLGAALSESVIGCAARDESRKTGITDAKACRPWCQLLKVCLGVGIIAGISYLGWKAYKHCRP